MESTSNGLGKLLPKAIASKRRRKSRPSSLAETTSGNDDVALQRESSNLSRTTTRSDKTSSSNQGHVADENENPKANERENKARDGNNNDEIVYDSGPESVPSRPTAISPHPSQIGYLTTSSPLVQAAHNPESQPSNTQFSEFFPGGSVDSLDSTPSIIPSESSLATPQVITRKTSAGRLRDVFRSKKTIEQSSSEERSPKTVAVDKSTQQVPSFEDLKTKPPQSALERTSTGRNRRLSRPIQPEPLRPPQTPPQADEGATPVIVNTPPTPTDSQHTEQKSPARSRSNSNASSPGNMITQRRSRAGSGAIGPSKLSNITSAPLTPTPESGPLNSPNNPATNFFSSMFSAVQNTATTFSNTISNTNLTQANKSRPSIVKEQTDPEQDSVSVESSSEALPEQSADSKEPAVKTLGMGDLSLSQLGIVEASSNAPTPVTAKFSETDSRARSESAPADAYAVGVDVPQEEPQLPRPRSLYDPLVSGDRTPPTGSMYEGKSGIQRSGSIRSAIGRRRKRGSSAATGGSAMTIGAAIAAANASVANPVAGSVSAPKLTGFAVATKKRNRDFHNLFKSVPDDDYLIEDYSCALQREILAHGRLYVSEGHLCFSSNILGWVTTLVMSFDEIVSVEKRSTALVFKNGLEISTLHAKHIFASFTSRDTTYDLIVKIWKLGHPHLQSSLNGVRLDETGGDKTEKIETESVASVAGSHSVSGSDDESDGGEDDIYDEDEDNDEDLDIASTADGPALEPPAEKSVSRKASGGAPLNTEKADESAPPSSGVDFPGPTAHTPTECGDADKHYDKIMGDDVVHAPLGKVYNLLFGPSSPAWMGKFLTGDQKCTELTMEDKKGLVDDNKSRTYTYIKPLGGAIGPKQTKCIVTENLERMDLERAVTVLVSTQTPDVPSGNIFVVKTRYCLSWAENNSTRIQANCTIEWSGKSWLKGPIEKGANDGQTQYFKDLFAGIKAAVSTRARTGTGLNGVAAAKGGGKKRGRKSKVSASGPTSDVEGRMGGNALGGAKADWGLFEPARPFLGPLADAVRPILTGNVVYGLLVGLIVATWFGFGSNRGVVLQGGADRDMALWGRGSLNYPQRLAAYEEMWRREESELWDWIEERAGLDRLTGGGAGGVDEGAGTGRVGVARNVKGGEYRTVEEKLREERMDDRELKEAIRITEERLSVLKKVVDGKETR